MDRPHEFVSEVQDYLSKGTGDNVMSRLEYLKALILNPKKVKDMARRMGYQTYQDRADLGI